jgi:hypothetical protein
MGLTPKEMKIAMEAGKVLVDFSNCKAYLEDGVYVVKNSEGYVKVMTKGWDFDYWQIYEEPKQVFQFKCFDRVLVKHDDSCWKARFFEKTIDYIFPFACTDGKAYLTIAPYEGNEDFATNPDGVKGIWTREML